VCLSAIGGKARLLGAAWRSDDNCVVRSKARFSLIQRWRAFRSLKVGKPWRERLALANEARRESENVALSVSGWSGCADRGARARGICSLWAKQGGEI
jgi:hypothetical protein